MSTNDPTSTTGTDPGARRTSATQPTGLMPLTRREYLALRAVVSGASFGTAHEAVSSVAIEHPEWDLAETKTFAEWDER
jgi:hypothetical protein